jgi:hypothetical protein
MWKTLGNPEDNSLDPFPSYLPVASLNRAGAVDGIKNGKFGFHTAEQKNPWWPVDLGSATGLTGDPARIQNTVTFSLDQSIFFVPFVNLSEAGGINSSSLIPARTPVTTGASRFPA